MRSAFKSIDLDRAGSISRAKLERVFKMWQVGMSAQKLDLLWAAVDTTGDGEISYDEFAYAFALDRTGYNAPVKHEKRPQLTLEQKLEAEALEEAREGLNTRFANMRKAFRFVDVDNSGTVNRAELVRALELWNVPMSKSKVDQLWIACDVNGNGEIEQVDAPTWSAEEADPTVRWVTKKVKRAGKAPTKKRVAKPASSFFRLFTDPAEYEPDDDADDDASGELSPSQLAEEVALRLREDAIPRAAIHYITALHGVDMGDDGLDFEDGDWEEPEPSPGGRRG